MRASLLLHDLHRRISTWIMWERHHQKSIPIIRVMSSILGPGVVRVSSETRTEVFFCVGSTIYKLRDPLCSSHSHSRPCWLNMQQPWKITPTRIVCDINFPPTPDALGRHISSFQSPAHTEGNDTFSTVLG